MADAISTAVGLLGLAVTGVYTALTSRLLGETRRMRQAQTEPEVIVYLEQSDRAFNHMNLVVRNIGAGTAFGVRLHVIEDWEVVAGKRVSELGLVRRGLDVLAAGAAIGSYAGNAVEAMKRDRKQFTLRVTYRSSAANAPDRSHFFTLDVSSFENIISFGEEPRVRSANALKQLADDVRRLGRSVNRFQVDVWTGADRTREAQRIEAMIAAQQAETEREADVQAAAPTEPAPERAATPSERG